MDDFYLVPVDHPPDFSDVSLVPVEHDPFGADGGTQQAPAQIAQAQPQPLQAQPQAVPSTQSTPTASAGSAFGGGSASPFVDFFNQLAAPERAESEGVADFVQNHPTAAKIVGAVGLGSALLPPLAMAGGEVLGLFGAGAAGSAAADGLAGPTISGAGRIAAGSAAGMVAKGVLPAAEEAGAKAVARGVARKATDGHHPWSKYLGGPVKQELVQLPRSLHVEFHRNMDKVVPKQRGKAYYESLGPEEKQKAFREFAKCTKEFDAEHGTTLYDALLKNGFPEP